MYFRKISHLLIILGFAGLMTGCLSNYTVVVPEAIKKVYGSHAKSYALEQNGVTIEAGPASYWDQPAYGVGLLIKNRSGKDIQLSLDNVKLYVEGHEPLEFKGGKECVEWFNDLVKYEELSAWVPDYNNYAEVSAYISQQESITKPFKRWKNYMQYKFGRAEFDLENNELTWEDTRFARYVMTDYENWHDNDVKAYFCFRDEIIKDGQQVFRILIPWFQPMDYEAKDYKYHFEITVNGELYPFVFDMLVVDNDTVPERGEINYDEYLKQQINGIQTP
jgi:hypothetical protein